MYLLYGPAGLRDLAFVNTMLSQPLRSVQLSVSYDMKRAFSARYLYWHRRITSFVVAEEEQHRLAKFQRQQQRTDAAQTRGTASSVVRYLLGTERVTEALAWYDIGAMGLGNTHRTSLVND